MSQGGEVVAVEPTPRFVVSADVSVVEQPIWRRVVDYGRRLLPVLIGAALILSLLLLVGRVQYLSSFGDEFTGSGSFQVRQCDESGRQWRCGGTLTIDGSFNETPRQLVASRTSMSASRPYVGEQLDVFFRTGSTDLVYPRAARLGELTRLYIHLVPLLLLFLGSLLWVTGWLIRALGPAPGSSHDMIVVERRGGLQPSWVSSDVGIGPLRMPSPRSLQRRGTVWMAAAVVTAVLALVLTRVFLGSLGLP